MLGRTLPACVSSHLWPSCLSSPKLCSCDSKRHPMPADCKASKMALLLWTKSLSKTKGEMHHSKVYGRGPSRHIHMRPCILHDTTLHCPCPTSFNLHLYITKPQPSSKKMPLFLAPFHMPHPWETPKTYAQSQRKRGSYVVRDHTIGQPIFIICCTLALHIYNY